MRRAVPSLMLLLMGALLLTSCAQQGALDSNESGVVGFDNFSRGSDKSFGVFVCAEGGEVTLASVEAASMEGQIDLLGSYVFTASEGFLSAVDGFPPTGLADDAYETLDGAVVSTACADTDPELKTQVIIGVRRTGPDGGLIEGIRIRYHGGTLDLPDYSIALCGDLLEHCEGLGLDG